VNDRERDSQLPFPTLLSGPSTETLVLGRLRSQEQVSLQKQSRHSKRKLSVEPLEKPGEGKTRLLTCHTGKSILQTGYTLTTLEGLHFWVRESSYEEVQPSDEDGGRKRKTQRTEDLASRDFH
jgi:hypothetical protein